MRKTTLVLTAILASAVLSAQDPTAKPIRSKPLSDTHETLDTLETSDTGMKLILFTNGTWKFVKDYSTPVTDSLMRENWEENSLMPYKISRDSLPYRITLCLIDSLESYCCPCAVPVYSKFGVRHGRNHNGVDLPSPTGTPTYAAFAGKVRTAIRSKGYGNIVILRHPNGLETYYGHLSRIDVQVGDWVEAGQAIGLIGSTGRSTGPHLHFETRYKGFAFDPQWIIDFSSGNLRKNYFILKKKYLSNYNRYTPESLDEEENILLTEEQERAEEERLRKEAEAMRWHTIKSGDTLSRIAANNGTTVSAICKLNPGLTSKSTLKIGRKIRVR